MAIENDRNLLEIELPDRDIEGVNFSAPGDANYTGSNELTYNPSLWAAYDGIIVYGGPNTRITPRILQPPGVNDDLWSCNISLNAKTVVFDGVDFRSGPKQAIRAGQNTLGQFSIARPAVPLDLHIRNSTIDASQPIAEGRSFWGIFAYQCDVTLENVVGNTGPQGEHFSYFHGVGEKGITWKNVTILSCGAQALKCRTDPIEVEGTAGRPVIRVEDCSFAGWGQPHSFRGGGAIVMEGSNCQLRVTRTNFFGGNTRDSSNCIFIDDTYSKPYWSFTDGVTLVDASYDTGSQGPAPANGPIYVACSNFYAGFATSSYPEMIRCATNAPNGTDPFDTSGQGTAESFTLVDCASYSADSAPGRRILRVQESGPVYIAANNTPGLKARAATLPGFDTTHETQMTINGGSFLNLSAGFNG